MKKIRSRVVVELVGGFVAICCAFSAYFVGVPDRFWIGLGVGIGCILLGSAALTLSQFNER